MRPGLRQGSFVFFKMIQLKVRRAARLEGEEKKKKKKQLTGAQTMLNCIDNSGAAIVECVAVMKKRGMRPTASIGRVPWFW